MKNKLSIIFVFTLLTAFTARASNMSEFLNGLDAFYKKYVSNGRVDYAGIKANKTDVAKLYKQVGDMNVSQAPKSTKKAFYINAYNLCVIKELAALYPVQSPLKIPGFFKQKKFKVAGQYVTLDGIEKKKLAALGADPRLHFALVCGAIGCPKLSRYAFRAEKLESQLNYRTKLAMKDTYFIRVKAGEKKVLVSEIFTWYKSEFVKAEGSVLKYINKYRAADAKIPASYSVGSYTYDWSINKKKR